MKILYFSGTGNGLYTAKTLVEILGGEYLNLATCDDVIDDEDIGIVLPNYCNDVPAFAKKRLEEISFPNAKYVFLIITAGASLGMCALSVNNVLKKKGLALSYTGLTLYVSSFIVTQIPLSRGVRDNMNERGENALIKIAEDIRERKTNKIKGSYLRVPVKGVSWAFIKAVSKNKKVGGDCIKCGLCESVCPTGNIKVTEMKIEFYDKCAYCYACAHWCPKEAVIYGLKEIKDSKIYRNPHVSVDEMKLR